MHALRRDDGVGLAAPQVGVNVRLMVYNPSGRRGDKEYVLVNPTILSAGAKSDVAEEGCLSFPRIFADVEARPIFLAVIPFVSALLLVRHLTTAHVRGRTLVERLLQDVSVGQGMHKLPKFCEV